ncbi:hypothetical protein BpHYR1_032517 [Brachionus plicatilis]|uniref:Uncharacterized protein n=1 Tax=Brachionus plicatilis TaxID=10195 RepID=A0A3M7Q4T9_BRAPC|nr:hypothetical protein BpHYR1_032517 [Brachionus plicatilis]
MYTFKESWDKAANILKTKNARELNLFLLPYFTLNMVKYHELTIIVKYGIVAALFHKSACVNILSTYAHPPVVNLRIGLSLALQTHESGSTQSIAHASTATHLCTQTTRC